MERPASNEMQKVSQSAGALLVLFAARTSKNQYLLRSKDISDQIDAGDVSRQVGCGQG